MNYSDDHMASLLAQYGTFMAESERLRKLGRYVEATHCVREAKDRLFKYEREETLRIRAAWANDRVADRLDRLADYS